MTSVTATYGSTMPAITLPTRSGYIFGGYYTSTGGSGTQYYKADGTSSRNYDLTTETTLYAKWKSAIPDFNYTGTYTTSYDETYWYIYFKGNGILTMNETQTIDAFLVGGGGGGAVEGGGGGYTLTSKGHVLSAGTGYNIVIGAGGSGSNDGAYAGGRGGTTTAFGKSAAGGYAGGSDGSTPTRAGGGDGGSGGGAGGHSSNAAGTGGSDGSNGANGANSEYNTYGGGRGQGTTTRAFGESDGKLYAGGGGGTGNKTVPQAGGEGGGATGIRPAADNTGGGGGGGWNSGGYDGGSGIVIIRGLL